MNAQERQERRKWLDAHPGWTQARLDAWRRLVNQQVRTEIAKRRRAAP